MKIKVLSSIAFCIFFFEMGVFAQGFTEKSILNKWEIKNMEFTAKDDFYSELKKSLIGATLEIKPEGYAALMTDNRNPAFNSFLLLIRRSRWVFFDKEQILKFVEGEFDYGDKNYDDPRFSLKLSNKNGAKQFTYISSENKTLFTLQVAAIKEDKTVSKEYYPNGDIKEVAKVKEFIRDGKKLTLYNGLVTKYDKGRILKSKTIWKAGVREGRRIIYHPNGKIKFDENFVNGKLKGASKEFFTDGNIKNILTYDVFEEGDFRFSKKSGPYKIFHQNGQLRTLGNYLKNKKVGDWKYYYKTGELLSEDSFKNGKRSGREWYYFKSGKVEKLNNYINGELNGVSTTFFESGKTKKKTEYLNGKRNGGNVVYHDNGKLWVDSNYRNGKLHGLATWYYDNGIIETKNEYQEGKLWNVFELNDKYGNSLKTGTIKNGTGKAYFYDLDGTGLGNLYLESDYKGGKSFPKKYQLLGMGDSPDLYVSTDYLVPIQGKKSKINWKNGEFTMRIQLDKMIKQVSWFSNSKDEPENLFVLIFYANNIGVKFEKQPLRDEDELFKTEKGKNYAMLSLDLPKYSISSSGGAMKAAKSLEVTIKQADITAENFALVVFRGKRSKLVKLSNE